MAELAIPGLRAETDRKATRAWYAASPVWDCACGHCRNFVELAGTRRFPAELLALLDKLALPPDKPLYVCTYYDKDGWLLYGVTWNVAGEILEVSAGAAEEVPWGGWRVSAHRDSAYPVQWFAGFPEPWFQLELMVWLPWVLNEPIDGKKED